MARCQAKGGDWILLAHGPEEVRARVTEAIAPLGLAVVAAADGPAALDALRGEPPAAAILQSDLPGRSGAELCRSLRRHSLSRRIPILMIVDEDAGEGTEALRAGASDVIRTPVSPVVLAHRLSAWLQLTESRHHLLKSRQAVRGMQRLAGIATFEVDIASGALECSETIRSLFDFAPGEELSQELLLSCIPPEDRQVVRSFFHMSRESGEGFSVETPISWRDGSHRMVHWRVEVATDEKGDPEKIVGSVQDVTERTRAEEQVRYLAYHDGLTGLTNRNAFMERLREAIASARRHRRSVALLFLDLDHFKRINDSLGHSTGDRLLQQVARRLEECVRQADLVTRAVGAIGGVSRLGGDEFTVLLSEISNAEEAGRVARRLLEALGEPIVIDGNELRVGVSIGVTLFPSDGSDVDSLLRNADVAMYQAKEMGRSTVQFYSQSLSESESRRAALEGGLARGLEEGRFELHYQPQVDVVERRVLGVEALLRWRDPVLGAVSPAEFVPVAEDVGLIPRLGEWVFATACREACRWLDAGLPPLRLSVNASPRQFESEAIVDLVGQTLFDTGLPADQLVLEVTETIFTRDPDAVALLLRELKSLGVRISLDDFGTGYSSLSYLKRFPVDELKIDHSFVRDVIHDPDDATIIQAILSIGAALDLDVVAEGVETPEQCGFLRERGCRAMQGHLFSPALPADEAAAALKDGTLDRIMDAVAGRAGRDDG
ncbi:MAG: two-component system response regulator [Deltaproteobacteria bacterium]|jgi:diguanylate cyclase (GGDEF)-like protein/PAS domain S-box-containing protein|nr:two-component system response regulator [Deltaproteobacteria bacterium]